MRFAVVLSMVVFSHGLVACQTGKEDKQKLSTVTSSGSGSGSAVNLPTGAEQIKPPLDLKTPPPDAVKTSTGLVYKKLAASADGTPVKRNDTVMINYTGWRQTGETFFTNKGANQPMPLPLANAAPGFTEAMQLLKKGEKVMLWIPPEIGYKDRLPEGAVAETLVYEVEIADVVAAPPVPPELGAAPATAKALPSGIKFLVVRPGTGTDKPKVYDTVTFNYSAWDKDGRMFDSTELRKRPAIAPPYRQSAAMEEILTSLTTGERTRFWVDSERMQTGGKPIPGLPSGLLTYEVELISIAPGKEPPKAPSDVAAPPASASKTDKGVFYKVLAKGKGGPKPGPKDLVRVHYTGWTTTGRMFESTAIKGEPSEFSVDKMADGIANGIPLMSVGDKMRFWVPDDLAYKGEPGKPQGMLVYDVELVELKAAPPPEPGAQPAPPDVAAAPADAKKTPRGVAYKILKPVKGAAHPKEGDSVRIHYTGWTTDGMMFDTSRKSGNPATFKLNPQSLIAGWVEGIPMVGVGESARLWIPQELAYPGGGGPQGLLVFDVELIAINPQ